MSPLQTYHSDIPISMGHNYSVMTTLNSVETIGIVLSGCWSNTKCRSHQSKGVGGERAKERRERERERERQRQTDRQTDRQTGVFTVPLTLYFCYPKREEARYVLWGGEG